MKRSEIKRTKPLERKTALTASPLARSTLHQNSAAHRQKPRAQRRTPPTVPAKVRVALALRSGGKCEIAAPGCTGTATDASHRIKVGMGGRKGDAVARHHVLSNLLHVDRHCHAQHLHAEPTAAYAAGWMLREHQDPLAEPVLYRSELRWLNDLGEVLATNPNAEEA